MSNFKYFSYPFKALKQLLMFLVLFAGVNSYAMPKVGDIAPDFETDEFKLSATRGKIVVLYFYPKDDTPLCTTEAQQFAARIDDFNAIGAEIIGVSRDSKSSHQKFKEKNKLPFALISDNKALTSQYGVAGFMWTKRTTFLIDREGKIAYIWTKVNVSKHAEDVLNKIKELAL
jgi:peroxiredoxin Q/BCP